uniref:Ulp1 protease family, C-terminal catalytic domain-containing protein n=1 Tax=Steinernema glaseri TaxID=37863 RepID=A0A1I8AWB4_9BILA
METEHASAAAIHFTHSLVRRIENRAKTTLAQAKGNNSEAASGGNKALGDNFMRDLTRPRTAGTNGQSHDDVSDERTRGDGEVLLAASAKSRRTHVLFGPQKQPASSPGGQRSQFCVREDLCRSISGCAPGVPFAVRSFADSSYCSRHRARLTALLFVSSDVSSRLRLGFVSNEARRALETADWRKVDQGKCCRHSSENLVHLINMAYCDKLDRKFTNFVAASSAEALGPQTDRTTFEENWSSTQ